MTQALEILLSVVISSLTVVMIILGIEFVFILKEIRKSIQKMNLIIDDSHTVSKTIADTVEDTKGFISGLKKGAGIVSILKQFAGRIHEEKD